MNQAIKNLPKMSDICSTNKNRLAFSTFLSCITHSVMHSLLQIKDDKDSLLEKAIELAQRQNKVSTSLLQRRLRIGYPRAARLMDDLEDMGIVGPSDGSKSRDVIIQTN